MCEELPAARRRHLADRPRGRVRLGSAAKETGPVGAPCSLPQAFLSPGYPQESAGKLKGWGSEMVSLSATRNPSAAWYFCEVLGRACVTGASPSAGISPFEGPLPSRRGDEPAQPIPSSSRGQQWQLSLSLRLPSPTRFMSALPEVIVERSSTGCPNSSLQAFPFQPKSPCGRPWELLAQTPTRRATIGHMPILPIQRRILHAKLA